MAHAIAKQFNNVWAKAATYSIGSIIPLSRLTANAHWLTDTALSAAISIVVVDCVDNFLNKTKVYRTSVSNKKIAWQLVVKPNQLGFVGRF